MTEAADRFDSKRLGRVAYEVAKDHFPQDKELRSAVRTPYNGWHYAASNLRQYPPDQQKSFFQTFFDRKSIQMPNSLRLARFLVTINNSRQPLSPQPDQTTDPYQLVREYFQNIWHPLMPATQIVQRMSEAVGKDMGEMVDSTLGSTKRQLYDTASAQQHTEALNYIFILTKEVLNSSILHDYIRDYSDYIGSHRFIKRYAEIYGGAIMVQALAKDNKQDPSFAIEPLIALHERGYLILGPVLTAEQQPRFGPARESTFILFNR